MSLGNRPLSEQPFDKKPSRRLTGFRRFLRNFSIVLVFVLAFLIYWFFYNVYSSGERTGILIKITRKGNIFKTNEGEMWLSCRQMTNPEQFYFTVSNDSITNVLKSLQDQCVQLSYKQYRAILPWRGDTKYIITGVTPIRHD